MLSLCPKQHPSSDGDPIALVWEATVYTDLPQINNAALKKIKPIYQV